jgi:hypothetical protein
LEVLLTRMKYELTLECLMRRRRPQQQRLRSSATR